MERIRYETPPEERFEPYDHVGTWTGAVAGAVMGALGALALISFPMFLSYVTNNGAFTPLRIIGTVGNARHMDIGTPTVLFGLFLLLGTGAVLGALFGALCNRQGRTGGSIPFGVGYSFLWLVVMTYALLPMMHQNLFGAVKAWPIAWFVGSFVYGLFVGMAPILASWGRARYARRAVRSVHDGALGDGPRTVIVNRAARGERDRPIFVSEAPARRTVAREPTPVALPGPTRRLSLRERLRMLRARAAR